MMGLEGLPGRAVAEWWDACFHIRVSVSLGVSCFFGSARGQDGGTAIRLDHALPPGKRSLSQETRHGATFQIWAAYSAIVDDDSQHIEKLPFVLVDSLDLAVKNCVRVNGLSYFALKTSAKTPFA
jgi:hypothetical protein